ncbi:MAG: hypothetical protein KF915_20675 [Polyangiaceae bacterium]|nr:hypothetical protein [Polyangiaceae bacterium]
MLVLLGPPFEGRNDQYDELARMTGLVAYELRTKLKPDTWGVVRALGDQAQASALRDRLMAAGYRSAVVDALVAHDPERPIVTLRALSSDEQGLTLHLQSRSMSIPWGALLVVVQGQVTVEPVKARGSSTTLRAVKPSTAEIESFRESLATAPTEAYLAADIHFITVPWIARVDTRSFDFGDSRGTPPEQLERLVSWLTAQGGVRVDAGARSSSVQAFTEPPGRARITPSPGAPARRGADEPTPKFDAYSRLIAEAERRARDEGARV